MKTTHLDYCQHFIIATSDGCLVGTLGWDKAVSSTHSGLRSMITYFIQSAFLIETSRFVQLAFVNRASLLPCPRSASGININRCRMKARRRRLSLGLGVGHNQHEDIGWASRECDQNTIKLCETPKFTHQRSLCGKKFVWSRLDQRMNRTHVQEN